MPTPRRKLTNLPLGDQIRAMRQERGLSLKDLEEMSDGLMRGTVSRVENGVRIPALSTMEELAQQLACTFVIAPKGKTYIAELDGKKG